MLGIFITSIIKISKFSNVLLGPFDQITTIFQVFIPQPNTSSHFSTEKHSETKLLAKFMGIV